MDWYAEQLPAPTSTPTLDSVRLFIDATKSLLDESDITLITTLASRLSPFRIDLRREVIANVLSVKPILVLDDEAGDPAAQPFICQELPLISRSRQVTTLTGTSNILIASATDSVQHVEVESPVIPNEAMHGHAICEGENGVSSAQDMDYDRQGSAIRDERFADGFQTRGHSPELTSTQQIGSAGIYFDMSSMSCHDSSALLADPHVVEDWLTSCAAAARRGSPDYSMMIPNVETVHDRNYKRLTGGNADEYPNDQYFNPTSTIQVPPFVSCTEDSVVMELSRSPSVALDAEHYWPDDQQVREENRLRNYGNTSSAQSVSQTARPLSVVRSISNDGQSTIDGIAGVLSDTAMLKAISAAHTCIRADYLHFLEMNLPHWVAGGLWHETVPPYQTPGLHGYENLQQAYSCLRQLEMRIRDDAIRSRVAMVLLYLEYENTYIKWKRGTPGSPKPTTGVGRGTISCVIDSILANTHLEWSTTSSQEKVKLRANFHDRKRFGKRWWILMDALGPSMLILCSSKFAGIIKNTTITTGMLQAIGPAVQESVPYVMDFLELVNPIAESLIRNRGYKNHDVKKLLQDARAFDKQLGEIDEEM